MILLHALRSALGQPWSLLSWPALYLSPFLNQSKACQPANNALPFVANEASHSFLGSLSWVDISSQLGLLSLRNALFLRPRRHRLRHLLTSLIRLERSSPRRSIGASSALPRAKAAFLAPNSRRSHQAAGATPLLLFGEAWDLGDQYGITGRTNMTPVGSDPGRLFLLFKSVIIQEAIP